MEEDHGSGSGKTPRTVGLREGHDRRGAGRVPGFG